MFGKVVATALLLEGPSLLVAGFPHIAEMVSKQRLEKREHPQTRTRSSMKRS